MNILVINFQLRDIEVEEYEALCERVAPLIAGQPGLISKYWLSNPEINVFGGVYFFESAEAVSAYRDSEIFAAMAANQHFAGVTVREFETLDGPTAITTEMLAVAS